MECSRKDLESEIVLELWLLGCFVEINDQLFQVLFSL
jgi:hypothetical protein